jgi:hypothetical protein
MEIQGTEEAIDNVILAIEAGRYVKMKPPHLQNWM